MKIWESKDFSEILGSYLVDFPECERKKTEKITKMMESGNYKLHLFGDDTVQAYSLSYHSEEYTSFAWVDYFAVAKECRGSGIGTEFLKKLIEKFGNIILEVEYSDGIEGSETFRRERFYKRLGAELIPIPYELPTEDASFPMNLFILTNGECPPYTDIRTFVRSAVSFIHSDFTHTSEVIEKYINSF